MFLGSGSVFLFLLFGSHDGTNFLFLLPRFLSLFRASSDVQLHGVHGRATVDDREAWAWEETAGGIWEKILGSVAGALG